MASPTPAGAHLKLAHFPVTMFAFVMGLAESVAHGLSGIGLFAILRGEIFRQNQ